MPKKYFERVGFDESHKIVFRCKHEHRTLGAAMICKSGKTNRSREDEIREYIRTDEKPYHTSYVRAYSLDGIDISIRRNHDKVHNDSTGI